MPAPRTESLWNPYGDSLARYEKVEREWEVK